MASPVVKKVLEIVAEKTGYPEDMLEMDLDLEADLGVDTVKQAETFAAVREAYGIARQENLKLRDFPTLKHVVQFVYDFRPDLKPAAVAAGPVIPRGSACRVPRDPPAGLRIPRRPSGPKLLGMTRPRRSSSDDKAAASRRRGSRLARDRGRRQDAAARAGAVAAARARPVQADRGGPRQGRARRRGVRRGRRRQGPRGALEKRGVAVLALGGATPTDDVTSRIVAAG